MKFNIITVLLIITLATAITLYLKHNNIDNKKDNVENYNNNNDDVSDDDKLVTKIATSNNKYVKYLDEIHKIPRLRNKTKYTSLDYWLGNQDIEIST